MKRVFEAARVLDLDFLLVFYQHQVKTRRAQPKAGFESRQPILKNLIRLKIASISILFQVLLKLLSIIIAWT